MFISYPAVFYNIKKTDSYMVYFPDFDFFVDGENQEEAFFRAKTILSLRLLSEDYFENDKLPEPSMLKNVKIGEGIEHEILEDFDLVNSFITIIALDLREEIKNFSKKKVEVKVKIPYSLKRLAIIEKLNLSKLLTRAIEEELDLM